MNPPLHSMSAERLYALLPAVHRLRDAEQGEPLRALLALMARELQALEENLDQLYDDQFIETCQEDLATYLGEVIGYRPLQLPGDAEAGQLSQRAEVANTLAYRRRKGTAAMLEQLARDVTGWPARAVEFFEQVATTQYLKHLRPHAQATADLRHLPRLIRAGGPFNALAHTAEMRQPTHGAGRYNLPHIGLFLWRLQPFRISQVPLTPDPADASGRQFRVHPLGCDAPLFRWPRSEDDISHQAGPAHVPEPLNLRLMARAVQGATDASADDDYGVGESLLLLRPAANPDDPPVPVPVAQIVICDLRDVPGGWAHAADAPDDRIAVDPRLGRVRLGAAVSGPLLVTAHHGFSRAIGGSELAREPAGAGLALQRLVRRDQPLQPELDAVRAGGRLLLQDSWPHAETPQFRVDGVSGSGVPGHEVVVAAASGARPLINAGGDLLLDIGARGRLVLDGLVIAGGRLLLPAALDASDIEPRELLLRDCTLVPGHGLQADGSPQSPGAVSLHIGHAAARVTLERCIVGAIRLEVDAELTLRDCIVDANAADAVALAGTAASPADGGPAGLARFTDCTVFGKLHLRQLDEALNTLFVAELAPAPAETWPAPLWVERRQQGCVHFCWLPPGAVTPRRHRCLPDDAHPDVQPHFSSRRYGQPAYAQLCPPTARALLRGARDEGEIGVMHALYQPQREDNLRTRLDEYLRFGLQAGLFHAT